MKSWRFAVALFVLGFVMLLLVHAAVPRAMRADYTDDYMPQVESLLAGRAFFGPQGELLVRYSPLQAVLTAATYRVADNLGVPPIHATAAVFSALASMAALFVALTVQRLTSSPLRALLGWVAALLCPQFVYASLRPLSEIPFAALLALAWMLFVPALMGRRLSSARAALLGATLGMAMLFRPIGILLPAIFVGLLVIWRPRRQSLGAAAFIVLGTMVTIAPWETFLYRQTGELVPLAHNSAMSLRDGLSFNHRGHRKPLRLPKAVSEISDRSWAVHQEIKDPGDYFDFLARETNRSPRAVLTLFAYKAARSWYATNTQKQSLESTGMIVAGLQLLLTALALAAPAVRGSPVGRRLGLLTFVWVFYFWSITTMVLSVARYTIPVFVLMPVVWAYACPARRRRLEGRAATRC